MINQIEFALCPFAQNSNICDAIKGNVEQVMFSTNNYDVIKTQFFYRYFFNFFMHHVEKI